MSRLVVLLYHRIAPAAAGRLAHLTVRPEQFAAQMTLLRDRGYAPQTQDDVAAWLSGRRDLPRRAVVVSFDDGYADNTVHAFPVLERLKIPAVTFVLTGRLGATNDWDDGGWRLMDGPAIQHWARRGLEFGAHGRTHRSLAGLDDAALAAEIDGSRADLAAILGRPPVAFAYPYGEMDARAAQRLSLSFGVGYGTREGINRRGVDRWNLRRTIVLPAYPRSEFACQLRLGWGPRNRAREILRRALPGFFPS